MYGRVKNDISAFYIRVMTNYMPSFSVYTLRTTCFRTEKSRRALEHEVGSQILGADLLI